MATGTVSLSAEQLTKLGDAIQMHLDVILTTDRRAGILSHRIVQRAMHLSEDVYPKAVPLIQPNKGLPVFDQLIDETHELADDMNDWIETLGLLGEEYDSLKATTLGFRERLP